MTRSQDLPQSPQAGDSLEVMMKNVKAIFRYCPPGTFLMGSPKNEEGRDDDETQHEVTLTRGFWLLETPVTQAQWNTFADMNRSWHRGADLPAEYLCLDDCAYFIDKLNQSNIAPSGLKFDLPTEAEWEYACRAGTTTPFSFGSTLNGDAANCDGSKPYGTAEVGKYVRETTPVKSFAPNAWGLFDMHGNVREWCSDVYAEYPTTPTTDPTGPEPPDGGLRRVLRGGGWCDDARNCRSASRNDAYQGSRSRVGVRLVLREAEYAKPIRRSWER